MKKYISIFVFISLLVSIVAYISMENLYIAIGMFVFSLILSIFFIVPLIKKHAENRQKFQECYHFINNFIISLSIKKSVAGAIETTVGSMPSEFVDLFNSLENMSENEKLSYLTTYFDFYDYQLFLQILFLWEEQGGDIFKMSKYLLNDIRNNEEYLSTTESLATRKYVEVGILWALTFAIIIFLRFSLKDFYDKVKGQLLFLISITAIIAFSLISIYLLIRSGTNNNLKGNANHEKDA